ncbi:MAG: YIP1 family protein [Nitrospiraceae bacterium]|nr:YIP1 family protein [Nitrospiraceae bacterium]
MRYFIRRMLLAVRLETKLYDEIKADRDAMGQAIAVVALSSIAAGVGSIPRGGPAGIVVSTASAFLSWFIWSLLVYVIGAKILPEPRTSPDLPALLRTAGFAAAPGIIRALGVIPHMTGLVFLVAAVWMTAAMVIAVRQALDYTSAWRAAAVSILGWFIQALITGGLMYAAGKGG